MYERDHGNVVVPNVVNPDVPVVAHWVPTAAVVSMPAASSTAAPALRPPVPCVR